MRAHAHFAHADCGDWCPAFDPEAWRCSWCEQQRPMAVDTEGLTEQLCDECYEPGETRRVYQ